MSNRNIDVLNTIAKNLIDSREGYERGAKLAANDAGVYKKSNAPQETASQAKASELSARFQKRAAERQALIDDIQNQIRTYGELPSDEGMDDGDVRRDFKIFSKLFSKDETSALSAIDKGEEDLAETITALLNNYSRLTQSTKRLLRQAYKDAKSRQRLCGLH